MNENNKLNAEQLDSVSGGAMVEIKKTAPSNVGDLINKYEAEAYIGKKVYAYPSSQGWNRYLWGTLTKSYEKPIACSSIRTHCVLVEGKQSMIDAEVGKEYEFCGDDHILYLYL